MNFAPTERQSEGISVAFYRNTFYFHLLLFFLPFSRHRTTNNKIQFFVSSPTLPVCFHRFPACMPLTHMTIMEAQKKMRRHSLARAPVLTHHRALPHLPLLPSFSSLIPSYFLFCFFFIFASKLLSLGSGKMSRTKSVGVRREEEGGREPESLWRSQLGI